MQMRFLKKNSRVRLLSCRQSSIMVHYKLTYFNLRARAEILRLIFAVADEKYEDVRVEDDKWPALKPSEILI